MGKNEKQVAVEAGNQKSGEEEGEGGQERGQWGGQLEFILTCVGYAVGLGNVWRFPYLCYRNGGGAFLIPYFLMLAFVGLPLFFLELCFGQFASLGPIAIWKIMPIFKGLGFAMVITNTIVALYYNIIIAWSLYYFFASMTNELPWTYCGNWWNTDLCFTSSELRNQTFINGSLEIGNMTYPREALKSPSEEYYYNQVLQITDEIMDLGQIRWQLALCLAMSWVIVFFVLIKGISSLGKIVYFSSTFPYVLLTIMLIRGVTLPNAAEGIQYYLNPDFERLTDAKVWSDAATQIFYSLSACTGGLIAMASFNKFNNNCLRDSILVPLINCGTSFYAGFVIFSVLGFMAGEKGVSVDDVAESGPGLVFIVYPEGLTQMPAPPVWSILFFFMLITLGFSSLFSMVECFFSSITDEFPGVLRRSRSINIMFRAICIIVFFAITLPMVTEGGFYLFNLIDVFIGGFPLLFIGLFESTFIMYIYGFGRFSEDIGLMLGKKPNIFFKLTWCIISPGLLFAIIIFTAVQYEPLVIFEQVYPDSALALGWVVVMAPLICIPAWAIYQLCADGGWEVLKKASRPTPEWGPADPKDRTGIYSITDKEEEERMSMKKNPSSVSFNASFTNLPTISNGNMYPTKSDSNGGANNSFIEATPFPGQPTMTSSVINQQMAEQEPEYAVVDRASKRSSSKPSAYTPPTSSKPATPSTSSTPRSGSSPSPRAGTKMVTDIDDVESNNSAQYTVTAQINSSGSEASGGNDDATSKQASQPASQPAGQSNKAFEEDESTSTTSF